MVMYKVQVSIDNVSHDDVPIKYYMIMYHMVMNKALHDNVSLDDV